MKRVSTLPKITMKIPTREDNKKGKFSLNPSTHGSTSQKSVDSVHGLLKGIPRSDLA